MKNAARRLFVPSGTYSAYAGIVFPDSPANTIGVMLPGKDANVEDPTCRRLPGFRDPIPTLPFLSTRKLVLLEDPIAKLACPAGALTESKAHGLVVPMPMLPPLVIRMRSPSVPALVVAKTSSPETPPTV